MDRETGSQKAAPPENLLVVKDNGRILSRRVSQVYGKGLLGAMALRMNPLPFTALHVSFLSQDEPLTLNKIIAAAQTIAPRDNFIFVDDSQKMLSCRVNPDHGVALLESLQQTPEEASQTQPVFSHAAVTQASEMGNDQEMTTDSPQQSPQEFHQSYASVSSSPLSTSGTPAHTLGILSDQILSSANRQPYDRDWMNNYNISETCLTGSPSKHQLDVLVRFGAVKVGDKLCVTDHPDGGPVVIVGEVSFPLRPFPFSSGHNPNFSAVAPRFCKV